MADDYYHFSDEDEREDEILDQAMERWEQMGGGGVVSPLFKFKMVPIGKRRQWRNVVQRQNFNAELNQLREPVVGDDIGSELTNALYKAIQTELQRQRRPQHHFVNFTITANGFEHAYQTMNFTVGEFLNRSTRLDELLQKLAGKLNSNESFKANQDFQVDVVFVRMPGRATGHGKKTQCRTTMPRPGKQEEAMYNCHQQ